MNPVIPILERAHTLISQGWTTGTSAEDADGAPVLPEDKSAVRWCLMGAVERATIEAHATRDEDLLALDALRDNLPKPHDENRLLSTFNDACVSPGPVLALIQSTIAALGGRS